MATTTQPSGVELRGKAIEQFQRQLREESDPGRRLELDASIQELYSLRNHLIQHERERYAQLLWR